MTLVVGGDMGANDVQALDANFKSWQENRFPNPQKGVNIFEYYCLEQFSRSFDLSDSQLKSGMTGGGSNGGGDGMYMFVNGELVEAESELDPKTPNKVRLLILQVKGREAPDVRKNCRQIGCPDAEPGCQRDSALISGPDSGQANTPVGRLLRFAAFRQG